MAALSTKTVIDSTAGQGLASVPCCPMTCLPRADWGQANRISGRVVDSALRVHSELGPGLLESAYRTCLAYELRKRGLAAGEEVALPVVYESQRLEAGYRIDVLVENLVIVEVKSVAAIAPVHRVQLLSYLKLSGRPVGLLLNFNVALMKHGIVRMRNG